MSDVRERLAQMRETLDAVEAVWHRWRESLPADCGFTHSDGLRFLREIQALRLSLSAPAGPLDGPFVDRFDEQQFLFHAEGAETTSPALAQALDEAEGICGEYDQAPSNPTLLPTAIAQLRVLAGLVRARKMTHSQEMCSPVHLPACHSCGRRVPYGLRAYAPALPRR